MHKSCKIKMINKYQGSPLKKKKQISRLIFRYASLYNSNKLIATSKRINTLHQFLKKTIPANPYKLQNSIDADPYKIAISIESDYFYSFAFFKHPYKKHGLKFL